MRNARGRQDQKPYPQNAAPGHLLAHRQGHEYFPVQSLEQQLLHEADSDELRSQHEEAAADL
ncbi:YncJ family protein, partial [Klebsiella pneumoniae]